jgi:hypothetical protein
MNNDQALSRPRDFALLLLASRDLRPRQRARDQRADTAGLVLKRRLLEHIADIDPEPADVEAVLADGIEQLGPPYGPARAVAVMLHEEWQAARDNPAWVEELIHEATD